MKFNGEIFKIYHKKKKKRDIRVSNLDKNLFFFFFDKIR